MLKSYNSFSLEYRPRKLEDLIGQEATVRIVAGMFARNKISRSILIHGEAGTGKTTLARIIALYANCLGKHPPCGSCSSCERGVENHPDVHEINMGDKTGVDYMRELTNSASYMPQSNFRIFLLDEIHSVTKNAFSALLKPLEEPPPHTIWILITTEPEKVIDTIYSRCIKLPMQAVPPEETTELLRRVCKKEHIKIDHSILLAIAQMCNGQPRDSLQGLEAVANYLAAKKNKGLPSAKLLKIVRRAIGQTSDALALQYLISVYLGRYTSAIKAINESISLENFLRSVTDYHINTCYKQINSKLCNTYAKYLHFFAEMDKYKVELTTKSSIAILNELVNTASKIRYSIDGRQLLISTTFNIINLNRKK